MKFKKNTYLVIDKEKICPGDKTLRRHKNFLTKGAFGNTKNIIDYKQSLRVLPKSKRTGKNCNLHGVGND